MYTWQTCMSIPRPGYVVTHIDETALLRGTQRPQAHEFGSTDLKSIPIPSTQHWTFHNLTQPIFITLSDTDFPQGYLQSACYNHCTLNTFWQLLSSSSTWDICFHSSFLYESHFSSRPASSPSFGCFSWPLQQMCLLSLRSITALQALSCTEEDKSRKLHFQALFSWVHWIPPIRGWTRRQNEQVTCGWVRGALRCQIEVWPGTVPSLCPFCTLYATLP